MWGNGGIAAHLGCFTPGKEPSAAHWIRGWVGPRVGLDPVVKRKEIPAPARN